MARNLALAIAAVALLAPIACGKKKPAYDRSTPEGTVRAFFDALNKHRIPQDLDSFFQSDREMQTWQMRCKYRGCTAGEVSKLEVVDKWQYRAVLSLDYAVRGNGGGQVMAGEGSPVTLIREGKVWKIEQFGRLVTPKRGTEDHGQ